MTNSFWSRLYIIKQIIHFCWKMYSQLPQLFKSDHTLIWLNNYKCISYIYICANANWQWGQVGWMLADHRDGLSSSSFLAWSSIAQSVCQQAFSLLVIGFQRPSGFESCIQQRKTTCLLSIRKSFACARASKLTTTNMYIARARCECQMAVGSSGLNACWS